MITFENGTKASEAYVTISGVKHYVTPAQYTGKTPLNATNLNANFEELDTAVKAIQNTLSKIIESGSNTNGSYIKFSDGTMICRKYINFGQKAISNKWGSFYESEKITIGNYPKPFIETPQIFIMPLNTFFIEKESSSISKTSWGDFYATRPASATMYIPVDCFAIGKWK